MNIPRLVVGTMSGTSLDGLDACLVEIHGIGLEMSAKIVRGVCRAFPPALSSELRALAERQPMTAEQVTKLSRSFALFHVEVINELLEYPDSGPLALDLVAVHGQTVFHHPPYYSWQLMNPSIIAHHLQLPVVCDMRAMDLASGGQGAPITPLADLVLFGDGQTSEGIRGIVNLGGFCNVTILKGADPAAIEGKDVCACNQLLDCLARKLLGSPYDKDGAIASKGSVHPEVAERIREYLTKQLELRRSLGTMEDPSTFVSWLTEEIHEIGDLLRSCCAAVARVIAGALGTAATVILAGGGARNKTLVKELEQSLPSAQVLLSSAFGVDIEFREAAEIAILGALCQDRVPITLPQVTHSESAVLSGVWAFPSRVTAGGVVPRGVHAVSPKEFAPSAPKTVTPPVPPLPLHLPPDRARLLTEQRNPASMNLHDQSVHEIVSIMQLEDAKVVEAMHAAAPALEAFILELVPRYMDGGRLLYIGCGTSGRLGVLDAAECGPTFNVAKGRVVGIIAGGDKALRESSEAAEDDPQGGVEALQLLDITSNDSIVGIAAGGTTPYVLNALRYLSTLSQPPLTALITCTPLPETMGVGEYVRHVITLAVGPEVVTGSTRMKAGTATKLALVSIACCELCAEAQPLTACPPCPLPLPSPFQQNTISTALFVKTGKVFENLMIDVRATNAKLVDRATRIIVDLAHISREDAFEVLQQAGGSCKTAIVMALCPGTVAADATELLIKQKDNVAAAIASSLSQQIVK